MKRVYFLLAALFAFEVFNYATTHYALTDALGDLDFAGIRWAAILTIAFCSIDLAWPARWLSRSGVSWYFVGAWALASAMNAVLTWWGVSLALSPVENAIPVTVAAAAWLARIALALSLSFVGVSDDDPLPRRRIPRRALSL